MLNRVYSIFDKRIRPLRNHVFLAFPKHGIAYARIAEPAFQLLRPVLHRLAGTEDLLPDNGHVACQSPGTERLLFHGDVELLTARELKRRYPEMKVVAWVQDPAHRLAYCYDRIILNSEELPAYYEERHFTKDMSPREFVAQVAGISDLEADNLFRSQTASLSYKGMMTADVVLRLENFEQSLARFFAESALNIRPLPAVSYRLSNFVTQTTLRAFSDAALVQKLKRRYRADYAVLYSREALTA
ncbi:sulfotransferase family 2 domain-containing protein [Roseibium sp. Sym1]|uniref:sulfotransferase family 2 domain-containing protein n=1 Tax=Roseibium sp. Sym1 TaxID=3016006 RepID=UPI0022B4EA5A|nr:sulfotransferase family 2 domain-containing protein [Roseibium sp. Sym1]